MASMALKTGLEASMRFPYGATTNVKKAVSVGWGFPLRRRTGSVTSRALSPNYHERDRAMVRIATGVLALLAVVLATTGTAQADSPAEASKERVYLQLSGLG